FRSPREMPYKGARALSAAIASGANAAMRPRGNVAPRAQRCPERRGQPPKRDSVHAPCSCSMPHLLFRHAWVPRYFVHLSTMPSPKDRTTPAKQRVTQLDERLAELRNNLGSSGGDRVPSLPEAASVPRGGKAHDLVNVTRLALLVYNVL